MLEEQYFGGLWQTLCNKITLFVKEMIVEAAFIRFYTDA
jgi:hypothetical protein